MPEEEVQIGEAPSTAVSDAEAEGKRLSSIFRDLEDRQSSETFHEGRESRSTAPPPPAPEPEPDIDPQQVIAETRQYLKDKHGVDPDSPSREQQLAQELADLKAGEATSELYEALEDGADPYRMDAAVRALEGDPEQVGQALQEWLSVDPMSAQSYMAARKAELETERLAGFVKEHQENQKHVEELTQRYYDEVMSARDKVIEKFNVDPLRDPRGQAIILEDSEWDPFAADSPKEAERRIEVLGRALHEQDRGLAERREQLNMMGRDLRNLTLDNRGNLRPEAQIAQIEQQYGIEVLSDGTFRERDDVFPELNVDALAVRPTPDQEMRELFAKRKPELRDNWTGRQSRPTPQRREPAVKTQPNDVERYARENKVDAWEAYTALYGNRQAPIDWRRED